MNASILPLTVGRKRYLNPCGLAEYAPLIVLLSLCVVTIVLTPRFASSANLTNLMLQASVMAVVAMGMTYVIASGGFDLSVGSTAAFASCMAAWTMLHFGTPAGLAAGIGSGLMVGLVNGWLVARIQLNSFIATLGTMVMVRGIALLLTGGRPVSGDEGLPEIFLAYSTTSVMGIPLLTWTPVVAGTILWWIMHRTPYGMRLFATGGNREAAYLAGISVTRVRMSAYVWCGGLAGLAGIMLASRLQSGQPTSGEFYELTAIAAVVLGGASLYGGEARLHMTVVGVLIMVVLANALNLLNVDSYWQRVAVGIIIVLAAAFDQSRHRQR